ncbi:MAG: hypothetical protein HC930_05660 [Hydrococcus sp. SU_1_0]|nr:hypothetical protein [Hydrococcus sp. SU_1_0]
MSRIKILLLILIIVALSIVFVQNREPITLKLLCADANQSCLYQTTPLPLAVWIAIATLTGAIANLLVQSLNRYGYKDSYQDTSRKPPILDEDLYPSNNPGGKTRNGRQGKYTQANGIKDTPVNQLSDVKSYEAKQEPKNVERSGSTYSYQYREAGDRSKSEAESNKRNSVEPEANANQESDDEDWI